MVGGCGTELRAATPWRARPGWLWEAAEAGGGGAPLLRCGRRKKRPGGPSGSKRPNRPVGGWAKI
jgi:hypothetical protein